MRYYELLYIVNPNLEDERVNGIIEEIGNEVGRYKVNIINHHIWGKKRLAFPIKNNKYGIYILLQFGAEQFDFLKELDRYLILSKTVIRHQIIKLDDEPKKVENIEIDDDDSNEEEIEELEVIEDEAEIDDEDEGVDDMEEEDISEIEIEEPKETEKEGKSSKEKQEEGK